MTIYVPYNEWDAQAGLIIPELTQEHDGYYTEHTERIVLDALPRCEFITEESDPTPVEYHIESSNETRPKYKYHLCWRPWNS